MDREPRRKDLKTRGKESEKTEMERALLFIHINHAHNIKYIIRLYTRRGTYIKPSGGAPSWKGGVKGRGDEEEEKNNAQEGAA